MAESTQSQSSNQYVQKTRHQPLTFKVINGLLNILGFLLIALLFSILIEWAGMMFIWEEAGSMHSQQVLKRELAYLQDDFTDNIINESPATTAFDVAIFAKVVLFEKSHLIGFWEWLKIAPTNASKTRLAIARTAIAVNDYFQALINTTVIYTVRVTVATLSMPAFLLVGLAALIDGLVQRELRIYGGGIERAMVYHHVKPWIRPAIVTTWFIYLSIPFSVHPNLIFGPAIFVFAMAVFLTAALFKKNL